LCGLYISAPTFLNPVIHLTSFKRAREMVSGSLIRKLRRSILPSERQNLITDDQMMMPATMEFVGAQPAIKPRFSISLRSSSTVAQSSASLIAIDEIVIVAHEQPRQRLRGKD
jgi:hypothetical protein